MKKSSVRWWVSISLLLVLLAAACTPTQTQVAEEMPVSGQDGAPGESFDADFIRMMVPHHESAVAMAEIARERSNRPEVLAMSDSIMATQQQEIDQMRLWLNSWYGRDDIPPMNEMPMLEGMEEMAHGHGAAPMDMQAEVEALRNAPEPFDLAFIDAMIEHHQSAISAAMAAQQRAERMEIQQMANQIIADQQAEIDLMQRWRQEWYENN
jgi:uncharacterized protein (DUF305 family)